MLELDVKKLMGELADKKAGRLMEAGKHLEAIETLAVHGSERMRDKATCAYLCMLLDEGDVDGAVEFMDRRKERTSIKVRLAEYMISLRQKEKGYELLEKITERLLAKGYVTLGSEAA